MSGIATDGRITVRIRAHLRALLDAEPQKMVLINDLLENHYKSLKNGPMNAENTLYKKNNMIYDLSKTRVVKVK